MTLEEISAELAKLSVTDLMGVLAPVFAKHSPKCESQLCTSMNPHQHGTRCTALCVCQRFTAMDTRGAPVDIPVGLCGNREDHAPHLVDSAPVAGGGPYWCCADQSKRLPFVLEHTPVLRSTPGVLECKCVPNYCGDVPCHVCGQYVNKVCWNCKTPRGAGACPNA